MYTIRCNFQNLHKTKWCLNEQTCDFYNNRRKKLISTKRVLPNYSLYIYDEWYNDIALLEGI